MFRGIVYETVSPATKDLPDRPTRGERIGRTSECDDDRGVPADGTRTASDPVWLKVYGIDGLDPTEGIFVEGYGPMAPVLPSSDG